MTNGEADDFWPLVERISAGPTISDVRTALMEAFGQLGFTAAYFLTPVVPDPRIGRMMVNCGFPDEWAEDYRTKDYLVDPLPGLAITRRGAFAWKEELAGASLRPSVRDYLARSTEHGLGQGIAVPCFGPFARCGFVGVGLPTDTARFDSETLLKVEIAARVSYQRYLRLSDPFPGDVPQLSAREIEVLTLMAQGKSNAVTAQLLGISPSSVDVYVKRVFSKLGVADRTSASVRALALGLVVTGKYPQQDH